MKLNSIYLIFAKAMFSLPQGVKNLLGKLIGVIFYDVFRFRRTIINSNLERAFPGLSSGEKRRLGRQSLVILGHLILDFFGLPFIDKKWVESHIVFDGMDHYQSAQKKGKGVLFLGMHMGSGECALGSMCIMGIPIVLIGKRFRKKGADNILFASRALTGMEFIPPHGKTTALNILKCLREGKSLVFVLDQHIYPPYGIATTFFGHHVGTAFGLALFAQKTGSPIIPLHTFRDERGTNHVVFGPEIPFVKEDDKEATLKNMTQAFNHVLEDTIRKHPGQWMWIHKRWKPFPMEEKPPES